MSHFQESLEDHLRAIEDLSKYEKIINSIVNVIRRQVDKGGKILIFGGANSTANCNHFCNKLMNQDNHISVPTISLVNNLFLNSTLEHDNSIDYFYSQQIDSLANSNDICIGLSVSGRSSKVIQGLKSASEIGCQTIGLTGYGNLELETLCQYLIKIGDGKISAVQEMHLIALNYISDQLIS